MGTFIDQVKPGTVVKGTLSIGQRAGGEEIAVVYHVIKGIESGPTIWFNGAVHGDELNGPIALIQLSQALTPKNVKGTVIITPVSNPLAFAARQKNTPQDLLDLDQQFPGNAHGTLSQRLAYQLFHAFGLPADYIIDNHTVGHDFWGQPYTVTKKISEELTEQFAEAKKLAEIFGGAFHCSLDFSKNLSEVPGNVYGFLDVQAQLAKKTAFMVELGPGGVNNQEAVSFALEGYKRLLVYLGILTVENEESTSPFSSIFLEKRAFFYADKSGFLTFSAAAGDYVKKGTRIAETTDLYGIPTEYSAPYDAYIIINRKNAVVESGDRLFFLGEVK